MTNQGIKTDGNLFFVKAWSNSVDETEVMFLPLEPSRPTTFALQLSEYAAYKYGLVYLSINIATITSISFLCKKGNIDKKIAFKIVNQAKTADTVLSINEFVDAIATRSSSPDLVTNSVAMLLDLSFLDKSESETLCMVIDSTSTPIQVRDAIQYLRLYGTNSETYNFFRPSPPQQSKITDGTNPLVINSNGSLNVEGSFGKNATLLDSFNGLIPVIKIILNSKNYTGIIVVVKSNVPNVNGFYSFSLICETGGTKVTPPLQIALPHYVLQKDTPLLISNGILNTNPNAGYTLNYNNSNSYIVYFPNATAIDLRFISRSVSGNVFVSIYGVNFDINQILPKITNTTNFANTTSEFEILLTTTFAPFPNIPCRNLNLINDTGQKVYVRKVGSTLTNGHSLFDGSYFAFPCSANANEYQARLATGVSTTPLTFIAES